MNVSTILEQIDEEISRLKQARALLTDVPIKNPVGRPKKDLTVVVLRKKRKLSAAGKARIAAAQKARWAAKTVPVKKTLAVKAPKKPVASAPAK